MPRLLEIGDVEQVHVSGTATKGIVNKVDREDIADPLPVEAVNFRLDVGVTGWKAGNHGAQGYLQIPNVVNFDTNDHGQFVGGNDSVDIGRVVRDRHEVSMAAYEAFHFSNLRVSRPPVVCWVVAGTRHHIAQRLVVHGERHHDAQTAGVCAAEPLHPHLLVSEVVPHRPLSKTRITQCVRTLVPSAETRLKGMDHLFADYITTPYRKYTAVRRLIMT